MTRFTTTHRCSRLALFALATLLISATSARAEIFVSDYIQNKVLKFSDSWQFEGSLDSSLDAALASPTSMQLTPDGQSLYVTNFNTFAAAPIVTYNLNSHAVGAFPNSTTISTPSAMLFQPSGNMLVSEFGVYYFDPVNGPTVIPQNLVYNFQPNGNALPTLTNPGMYAPGGMATGPDGKTYITATVTNQVYAFNPDGTSSLFINGVATPGALLFNGNYLYVSSLGFNAGQGTLTRYLLGTDGGGNLTATLDDFANPISGLDFVSDFMIGPNGKLWVASQVTTGGIQQFDLNTGAALGPLIDSANLAASGLYYPTRMLIVEVPEPETWLLMTLAFGGFVGVAVWRKRHLRLTPAQLASGAGAR